MVPLLVEGEAAGHLPADAVGEGPSGVAIGQSLQGLEHHDGGDDVGRDRGTAPARGEQILEQLVREQLMTMVGQERLDACIRDELSAQCCGVEQLTVGFASSLHAWSLAVRARDGEHPRAICSAAS
jgi:hypothetical protein